jgi:hypothetical protein
LSEQVFPPKRSLSKGLLIIGMVLLVSSFLFFYLASRIDYDYVTKYDKVVNFDTYPHFDPSVNSSFVSVGVQWMDLFMRPHDYLTVKVEHLPTNGTVSLALESYKDYDMTTFPYISHSESGFIDFRNDLPTETFVSVFLASNSQNMTFSLPTTTTLHHYETPNWLFFGAGVVLASLGLVAVFKSKEYRIDRVSE